MWKTPPDEKWGVRTAALLADLREAQRVAGEKAEQAAADAPNPAASSWHRVPPPEEPTLAQEIQEASVQNPAAGAALAADIEGFRLGAMAGRALCAQVLLLFRWGGSLGNSV